MRKLFIMFVSVLILFSVVSAETNNGSRNCEENSEKNMSNYSKIIFYNNSNKLLYVKANAIGIEINIDGEKVTRIKRGQYGEVIIEKGKHDVILTHWDAFKFANKCQMDFVDDQYVIELYCSPVNTLYKMKQDLPKDFHEKYEYRSNFEKYELKDNEE